MKKYISLALISIFLVSCGTKKEDSSNTGAVNTGTVVETSTSKVEKTEEKVTSSESDEKQVQEVFEKYQDSLIKRNGAEASKLLSSETVNYYTHLLNIIKKANKEEILKMKGMDAISVLHGRFSYEKDVILSFKSGEDFLIDSVNKGMIGKEVGTLKFSKAEISGDNAKVFIIIPGNEESFPLFNLVKENGAWKIDLISITKTPEFENIKLDEKVLKETYGEKYESLFEPLEK